MPNAVPILIGRRLVLAIQWYDQFAASGAQSREPRGGTTRCFVLFLSLRHRNWLDARSVNLSLSTTIGSCPVSQLRAAAQTPRDML